MKPIQFIPLMITTFSLAFISFKKKTKNKFMRLIIAFIFWIGAFSLAFLVFNK